MQGMLRPFTPMGMSAMRVATAQYFESVGIPADPFDGHPGVVDAAGRMYLDITGFIRYRPARAKLPAAMAIYGPRVTDGGAAGPGGSALRARCRAGRTGCARCIAGGGAAGARAWSPGWSAPSSGRPTARERAFRAAARGATREPATAGELTTAADRLRFAMAVQGCVPAASACGRCCRRSTPPCSPGRPRSRLLAGVATESEVDETLRGMPHNVTTEMDLALWRLAAGAPASTAICCCTPRPPELAARYLAGELPDIGLDEFLRRYGHRGAAEVDVGVPRWAEDPTPVFAAIAGYLRVTDPGAGARTGASPGRRTRPRRRSTKLVRRARRTRPVRARWRASCCAAPGRIAGLRELPKFAWLYAFARDAPATARGRGRASRARPAGPGRRHHVPRPPRGLRGRATAPTCGTLVAARRADYERETAPPHRPRAAAVRRNRPGGAGAAPVRPPTGRWPAWRPRRVRPPAGPG